jgi:predicted GH43/DUF377 family glycosyl hydrolase
MLKLVRHPQGPLMYPNPLHRWESMNVFNPSVIHHNGLFHMHYRAQGVDFISSIGYAVSTDGLNWNRLENPVLAPHMGHLDYRGNEDPRVTPLEGRFYMTYTVFGGEDFFPMIAVSDNLITWEDIGPMERQKNKDHIIFPEKVNGRYAILHRRPSSMWIGYSDDLKTWTDHKIIMDPRPDNFWDSKSIGGNGLPIKTEHGWVLFYHGYESTHIYRHSIALLDLDDPSKVIHRPKSIVMEPQETWEIKGDVPNVVFSCTNLIVGDEVWFYYAGADRLIALATAKLSDVIDFARFGE